MQKELRQNNKRFSRKSGCCLSITCILVCLPLQYVVKKKKFMKEQHFGLNDMCTLMSIDVSCAIKMHQWLKVVKNPITQGM